MSLQTPSALPTFDDDGNLNAIVETPKGSRNKFKYDEKMRIYMLRGVLPLGDIFPFDFGFLPSTVGDDGDPLDILVLNDAPCMPGCLVPVRLLGVIEAEQSEDGKKERNDRLIGIAAHAHEHSNVKSLKEMNPKLLDEIEEFFISYNKMRGKKFKPMGRYGPKRALKVINRGMKNYGRKAA